MWLGKTFHIVLIKNENLKVKVKIVYLLYLLLMDLHTLLLPALKWSLDCIEIRFWEILLSDMKAERLEFVKLNSCSYSVCYTQCLQ